MFEIEILCPYCNGNITQNWSEYITDSDVINPNRQMGHETAHNVECDDYECPHCHKHFSVTGPIYEYPEGAGYNNGNELITCKLEDDSEEDD